LPQKFSKQYYPIKTLHDYPANLLHLLTHFGNTPYLVPDTTEVFLSTYQEDLPCPNHNPKLLPKKILGKVDRLSFNP